MRENHSCDAYSGQILTQSDPRPESWDEQGQQRAETPSRKRSRRKEYFVVIVFGQNPHPVIPSFTKGLGLCWLAIVVALAGCQGIISDSMPTSAN